jgi:hypothetical protein
MRRRLRNPLASLLTRSRREDFLAQYVLRQCRGGRTLEDVLADPYVTNRSTAEERARLLDRPEVVEAIGTRAVQDLERDLGAARAHGTTAT